MPIFVEHWGIICNFTPILPYFQHWGMNLDHNFVQVRKLSEDQKKDLHQKWNTFPEFKWTPALRCTPESNYCRECRCRPTQAIGGDTIKLWEGYIPPHPPPTGFRHPCSKGHFRILVQNNSLGPYLELVYTIFEWCFNINMTLSCCKVFECYFSVCVQQLLML